MEFQLVHLPIDQTAPDQIYLVTLRPTQFTQASSLQKKSNVAKCFFDTFKFEIAQCREKLDIILGKIVVQF